MKDDKRNLPDERRALLNRASYLYSNDQTRKYSFKTNKRRRKGYEFTRMVVTTTVRGATRTNKDNKGYEFTRPAVKTAVRRNPNEQKKKKGLEILERL